MFLSSRSMKFMLCTALLNLTGCLENIGTTESIIGGGGGSNNSNFSVVTAPPDETIPPDAETPTLPENPTVIGSDFAGFLINQGATRTASTNLRLDFYPPFYASVVKVSQNKVCDGGVWEEIVPSSDIVSSQKNKVVDISVQYIDNDKRSSPCYTQAIAIDQLGPDILFNKYPTQAVESGANVEIIFNVTDALSDVSEVLCSFQGIQKTCGKGSNTINIPSIAEGNYTIAVSAKDSLGNSSAKSISFVVTSIYKNLSQKVAVTDNKSVDILIVIDNSGSMEYEQKSMGSRTAKFLEVLRGLNYQIAITTTDPSNSTYGDGRFVTLKGASSQYIINSSMSESTAQTLLSNTLQRTETGSGSEQAIYASTRAVERALANPTSMYGNFFRTGAQFAVLVISDEDESADGTKNNPTNLLKLINTNFGGNKSFSFHSIITRPNDTACKSTNGAAYGHRYAEFSSLTGGVIGDVCATDYTSQVQSVAEGVRQTLKTITLSCAPIVDSFHNIVALKDGIEYKAANTLSGLNLVFSDILPIGNYEVMYSCLK